MAAKIRKRSGVGLAEIARRTKLSLMTVSRALRGVGRVDPATRDRVWSAASDLGYRRAGDVMISSPVARGSSGRDLRLVLPMLGDKELLDSSFGLLVFQAITGLLDDIGGSLTVRSVPTVEAAVALCSETRAHGIILRQALPKAWLDRLTGLAPVALVGAHDYACGLDTVYTSEFRAASLALDHLVGLGHRSVAWFGIVDHHAPFNFSEHLYSPAVTSDRMANSNHYPRYASWQNLCLPVVGLSGAPDCHLVLLPRDWREQTIDHVVEQGLERILALSPRPTAVVLPTDPMGQSWLRACSHRGVRIPEDLSVLTYGSIVLPGETTRFTSIYLPVAEQGRLAVEMLQRRIARPGSRPVSIQLEPELLPGETTRPPAGG
jgi:DNA-binding LacI/PurR family transcriptional regulator